MNLTMTIDQRFWGMFLQFVIVAAVLLIAYGIFESVAEKIERKREIERRACKRYNAPIRPTHRY